MPRAGLFDDLVGAGEDRWRDSEAERLDSFEIDDQFEFVRLLHRDVGWLGSLENLDELSCHFGPVHLHESRAVSSQAASFCDFGPLVDGGKLEHAGALDDQPLVVVEQSCRQHIERLGARCLGRIDRRNVLFWFCGKGRSRAGYRTPAPHFLRPAATPAQWRRGR